MIAKSLKCIACLLAGWLCWVIPTFGAQLMMDPTAMTVGIGQEFEARVLLDTQDQAINAVEGTLIIPDNLTVTSISDGNSVLDLWIERPDILSVASHSGRLTFSGIVPGGFTGKDGRVFTIRLKPIRVGSAYLSFQNVTTLLNDGHGTAVSSTEKTLAVVVSQHQTSSTSPIITSEDRDPPEPFTIVRAQDPNAFDGKWFVAFATQDKGSGVDHYELRETPKSGTGAWQTAISPYLLQDQSLHTFVEVKAVDRAGNERVSVLAPPTEPFYRSVFGIGILCLLALAVAFLIRRRLRHRSSDAGGQSA